MDADDAGRWFDSYLADFIALGRGDLDDVRRILDHYGVPMLVSTDAGSTVLTDEDQVLAMAEQQVDGMRAAGYDRSEELARDTTALNGTCAVHRGRFARLRAEGTEIGRLEATYVITDGAGGRRISAIALAILGLALALARIVPRWTAVLLAAAGFLWPVSRIPRIEVLAHVADLTLLVPSAFLGVLLLTSLRRPEPSIASMAR